MPSPGIPPATTRRLDRFLHATVGTERNDIDLPVLSVLARSGKDPWAEAARLAGLPRAAAADELAGAIAGLPGGSRTQAQARAAALRLVPLLPGHALPPSAATPADDAPHVCAAVLLIFGGTLAAALMFGLLLAVTLQAAYGTAQPGSAASSGQAIPHVDRPAR